MIDLHDSSGGVGAATAPHPSRDRSTSQALLVAAIEEVMDAMAAGQPVDRETLLAKYADVAKELEECLSNLDFVQNVAPQLADEAAAHPASSHPEGTQHPASSTASLGDFRILREIGRGGMGVVYEAEQLSLGRRVALKVLPFAAMLDKQQLARFKNEARAAATLDHPNIVAIYSVGVERGVHYYAMQLIEGQSLAQVVEQLRAKNDARCSMLDAGSNKASSIQHPASSNEHPASDTAPIAHLTTLPDFDSREYYRSVAKLGIQAAEALDHAHQNGILHRDIKPANLLVDDAGKLWITDFGLARMEQDAGMTMTGDILGTLRYMSPEQALAKRVVVDHRSDIYSLGVTLYELLTLQPAFTGDDRQELLRQIAFEEPRKLRQITSRVPQDLETIILKATEKNPADRYATAREMADDVRRFLENQPIKAKPQSSLATLRKWSRRHRGLLAAATVLLVTLTVGSLISMALLLSERERTKLAAAESKAVADFLLNDLILAPNRGWKEITTRPTGERYSKIDYHPRKHGITVFEALERAEPRIATSFRDQPLIEAAVRCAIGLSYRGLGRQDRAATNFRRAMELRAELLGEEHYATLQATDELALTLARMGDYAEAKKLCENALEVSRRKLGPDHLNTLWAMKSLVRIFIYGEESITDVDLENAQKICEEALQLAHRLLGAERSETVGTAYDLALILRMRSCPEEALRQFQQTLSESRGLFGADNFLTICLMTEAAKTLIDLGRIDEAHSKLLAIHTTQRRVFGNEDVWTLETKLLLANVQSKLGKEEEAVRLYGEVLEITNRVYDRRHQTRLQSISEFAWVLATTESAQFRDGERALKLAHEACELTNYTDAKAIDSLAAAYAETGNFEAAVEWSTKALKLVKNDVMRKKHALHLESFQAGRPWRDVPNHEHPGIEE